MNVQTLLLEGRRQGVLGKAIQFLSELLENGPLLQTDIEEQYLNEGYSHSTIKRAKSELQIKAIKKGGPLGDEKQKWIWSLPNCTNEND